MSLNKKGFFINGFIPDSSIIRSNMNGEHDYAKLYRKVASHIRWASDRINNKETVRVSLIGFSDDAVKKVLQVLIQSKYVVTPLLDLKQVGKTTAILIRW